MAEFNIEDYNTREFWKENSKYNGEQLAKLYGGWGSVWRRRIVKAKASYPEFYPKEVVKVSKGVCYYDLHYPAHNKELWTNFLEYVKDLKPDVFVFGGDNLDMEVVSHWTKGKHRRIEGTRLKEDYDGFTRDILEPLERVLPDGCRKIFLEGNHELWVERYIDEHPEVEGFFEVRRNLPLDDWEWYDYGTAAEVGKLFFIHGEFVNQHNAMKTVQTFGRNVVYGHGHTLQAFVATTPLDVQSHMAMQIPCTCEINPHYRKNRPNGWLNGFGVFYNLPNGNFNLLPVIATDNKFVAPNGKFYDRG